MRRQGTGSISQRPDGRWMGQIELAPEGGKRRRRCVYGWSRAEVERKVAVLLESPEIDLGNARKPADGTFHERLAEADVRATHSHAAWMAKRDAVGCCIYCGSSGPLVQDHAVPPSRGGDNGIANVVPSCHPCNAAKGSLTAAEFIRRQLVLA